MRCLSGIAVAGLCGLLFFAGLGLFPRGEVPPWEGATRALGAENAVAAIVLGARLWDTLLEVLVFAVAMVGVRIALRPLGQAGSPSPLPESHLVQRAADVLIGPIGVFALYLAASGHLGPGGGFPAGAIMGSGLLLLALAKGAERVAQEIHERTLEHLKYGAIALLFAGGVALTLARALGSWSFIAANLLIGLEVAIGAWVVLHSFATHRGEV